MKLDMKRMFYTLAISALSLVLLDGCGGGNHSPLPGPGAAPVNAVTGVAATGSPVFGTVKLKDASSPSVELTTSTASDGTFLFDTAKLKAPFILKVVDANNNAYYSISTAGNGITNINPLTTMVVSVAAGGTDLNAFYNAWYATASATAVLNLPTADSSVQTALKPVLDQFSVSGSLLNSTYVADHTGPDAMLDVIAISVSTAGTITLANKSNAAVIFTAPAASVSSGNVATANIPAVPVQTWGATLYRANCMRCHGDLPNSTIIGINTVAKITNAIATDLGGMSAMGGLTSEEIQAINDAIPTQAQAPAPGASPGETLYNQKCAACHKQLTSSTKAGASLASIQNGIATVPNMASLKSLTTAQLTDIASALATVTPPTPTPGKPPGQALYVNYCESCHTPFANSDRAGATATRINGAIAANTGSMGSLNKLTPTQITDIATALATVTPPAPAASTGETLYGTYCSACHGAFATSSKAGATVSRINTAVAANTGGMAFVTTSLTQAQLKDIETALGTLTVPVITDGATLYATNCSGCHDTLANSTKKGLTLARFNTATANNSVTGMGYLASLLSVDQVNAIISVMPPLPVDGAGLYTTNCASCHGPLTASAKAGPTMTVARIQGGIAANPLMAGFATSLTVPQLALIANTLAALPAPALDGPALYAANCLTCHGSAATSGKTGPSMTVARIQAGIAANAGMSGFATSLTVPQLTLIANTLAALPAPALDGSGLYAANCASCHGALATSAKAGPTMTVARIQAGIAANAGMAGFATSLTVPQLTLISNALAALPAPALDGPGLYAANCQTCHGTAATSGKTGPTMTVARIQAGIAANAVMGGFAASLTVPQLTLIANTLAALPAPVLDGPGLYAANCASCHGVLTSSAKAGPTMTVARIQAGIAANAVMSSFATSLTVPQLTLIANTLAALPAPVLDGAGLYAANCASCHNPLATSAKAGPTMTVARIQAGIAANAGMAGFATSLTVPQLTLISDALAALPAPVLDGPGLYAANCASCHNALATSTKGGATAAKIKQEITNNRAGVMGAANLVALTPSQLTLIEQALAPIAPPACGTCHSVALGTPSITGTGVLIANLAGGHSTHNSKPKTALLTLFKSTAGCEVCHGVGYTIPTPANSTTRPSALTHNDGNRTVNTTTTGVAAANPPMVDASIVWVPPVRSVTGTITTKGTCSPQCHSPAGAKRSW